ncbi:putative lipoprotein YiaD [Aquicella siphonis]|uniref:Putative lipoprotein YiaD n=1 Tax=Aquicella siphonis TaxID=254247 RepID=A0A5E4PI32_9COXI|nr:OmpA family protein [Aquicella siphonis]VVC76689.1 putative lipoprotein YiaD [Aquicella siphonis]
MYSKVEKRLFARVGALFSKEKLVFFSILAMSSLVLCGCASSNVSRDVTSNIDDGVDNARNLIDGTTGGNVADSYQNASQRAKGAMLGGAAGGVTGAMSSAIGIVPGAVVGAVLGASYGGYIDNNASVEDQLQNRGATVVVLGDQILIVLPSARIFNPMSSKIKPDAYSTLNLVSKYINSYTKMLVKVAAYTGAFGSNDVNLSLSQEQAESVAKYLSAAGVNARVLYATGYGGTHLVQRNSNTWDGNENYRIEITLEKLYV